MATPEYSQEQIEHAWALSLEEIGKGLKSLIDSKERRVEEIGIIQNRMLLGLAKEQKRQTVTAEEFRVRKNRIVFAILDALFASSPEDFFASCVISQLSVGVVKE